MGGCAKRWLARVKRQLRERVARGLRERCLVCERCFVCAREKWVRTVWDCVRLCGLAAWFCGLWNLFGDLCFMDFYLAHMTFDGFGTIAASSRPGRLFDFSEDSGYMIRPRLTLTPSLLAWPAVVWCVECGVV